MSNILDELRKTEKTEVPNNPKLTGYIWVTMLIKYNTDGGATLISSFSKPAKDSDIKFIVNKKKQKPQKIEVNKEEFTEEDLFD